MRIVSSYIRLNPYLLRQGVRHWNAAPPFYPPESGWNLMLWG